MSDREYAEELRDIAIDPDDPYSLSRWYHNERRAGASREGALERLSHHFASLVDLEDLHWNSFGIFKRLGIDSRHSWDLILKMGALELPEGLKDFDRLGRFFSSSFKAAVISRIRKNFKPIETFSILAGRGLARSSAATKTREIHKQYAIPGMAKAWKERYK